jgi:hypothetical protein
MLMLATWRFAPRLNDRICRYTRAMQQWEYCAVYVSLYASGSGGGVLELLELKLPGHQRESVQDPFGSIGLLNRLGQDGWELVDVEGGAFFLKRPVKS